MQFRSTRTVKMALAATMLLGTLFIGPTDYAGAQETNQVESAGVQAAVGTAFTYQGRLTDNGNPASGMYDFVFELYDAEVDGAQIGDTISREDVEVTDGYFSLQLDFGRVFMKDLRYLQIGMRPGGSAQTYVTLTPRRPIMSYPVAGTSLSLPVGTEIRGDGALIFKATQDNSSATGTRRAIVGQTNAPGGQALHGAARNGSGANYGIFAFTDSENGFGGYFLNKGNTGGTGAALVAKSENPNGVAAKFFGEVQFDGRLTKSSGSFKIDHPLDPTNKYLYHSFVESPDMMNIYNGNITLDENGEAWVQMPDWFEALNQEFRYQLTPIGAPGPNLYIAQQLIGNRFQISGGEAGSQVSWQVTGIRHDPYAAANRIPIEEDKPNAEIGTYLHPEAHGAPAEQGAYFQASSESASQ